MPSSLAPDYQTAAITPLPVPARSLASVVANYLASLENSNRSKHTLEAYRLDLAALMKAYPSAKIDELKSSHLSAFFVQYNGKLAPATRARKQAAISSFFEWAVRHDYLEIDPTARLDRVKLPPPAPRGVNPRQIERVLAAIPKENERDRLLFGLIYKLGLRASEAAGMYVSDLDLREDDEHVSVLGKGQKRRTILLDDSALVKLMQKYLKKTGYKEGPLFRATVNGKGGPMTYRAVNLIWQGYCKKASVEITLHQLRHTHATELINAGVSLNTIKKRLGHANMQTTLRYAEQSDQAADREMREYQRRKQQGR